MTIDMDDRVTREQVEASAYAMSVTPVALVSAIQGAMDADVHRARTDTVHCGHMHIRIPSVGPTRVKRELEYRVRKAELAERLEITGGTGNLMVNMCRSLTRQAAADKARRVKGGPGQTRRMNPNDRLRTYGLQVMLDARTQGGFKVIGGTARQRACYLRAVGRYMGHGDPIGEAL